MSMTGTMACQPGTTGAAASSPSPRAINSDCPTADRAIVTLTYDDNLQSQLANAVLALNDHNMRGTFFVNNVGANADVWKNVLAAGHELGAHTLYHPCTAQFDWVEQGNASEDYTLTRMAKELDDQITMLTDLGANAPFSFAYPCGTTWIGSDQTSYIPLIKERFIAARGVSGDIITQLTDPMNVPAYFLEGPLEAFIGSASAAIADKGWVVFGFHGIGGDHLAVSSDDHSAFLDWLSERQHEVVVLPFREAARCMLP